jgi:GNAT superfamily N-acetyltransferase
VIHVERVDPHDPAAFDEWFAVQQVTDRERWPDQAGWHREELLAWVLDEVGPEEHRPFLARSENGQAAGIAYIELYRRENTHVARLDVRVLPDARRRGVGTALVETVAQEAARSGRRELTCMDEVPSRPGYVDTAARFARHLGFAPAQHMVRRNLRLPMEPGQLEALRASPRADPAGYVMRTFGNRWPDEYLEDRCELGRRMSTDVPTGEQELDEEVWDTDRVRQIEALLEAQNRDKVTTVAEHVASGRLVGFTEVAIPRGDPEWVWQHDTLVIREHRGHGLGFAMKLANVTALLTAYPQVRCVSTWNAAENEQMIAVNDELGYDVTGTSTHWLKQIAPLPL